MPKTPQNELTVNRAECPGEGKTIWRLVHDGSQVLAAFKTAGQTECIHSIADFDTFEEMDAAIKELNLKPLPQDEIVDRDLTADEYQRTHHLAGRRSRPGSTQ